MENEDLILLNTLAQVVSALMDKQCNMAPKAEWPKTAGVYKTLSTAIYAFRERHGLPLPILPEDQMPGGEWERVPVPSE